MPATTEPPAPYSVQFPEHGWHHVLGDDQRADRGRPREAGRRVGPDPGCADGMTAEGGRTATGMGGGPGPRRGGLDSYLHLVDDWPGTLTSPLAWPGSPRYWTESPATPEDWPGAAAWEDSNSQSSDPQLVAARSLKVSWAADEGCSGLRAMGRRRCGCRTCCCTLLSPDAVSPSGGSARRGHAPRAALPCGPRAPQRAQAADERRADGPSDVRAFMIG